MEEEETSQIADVDNHQTCDRDCLGPPSPSQTTR